MKNLKIDLRAIVFWVSVVLTAVLYRGTLAQLLHLANNEELYSYLPLVPVVSLYTLWYKFKLAPVEASQKENWGYSSSTIPSIVLSAMAIGFTIYAFLFVADESESGLTVTTISWILWVAAIGVVVFGKGTIVKYGFSLIYLIFMVPLPQPWVDAIVAGLQKSSADALGTFLAWSNIPYFRVDYTFAMPQDLNITVAPECSGIDSTYALLMTAVLASFLFLRSNVLRTLVVLFVAPLSIARNGLRIYTIVMATLYWNPNAIDGPIHRQGGKPFFVLALIPLFLMIYLFKRLEKGRKNGT